mmetsp:Transcript_4762/g.17276  ORF Transcript_4762/g.17276 Transcript_4762/m.17276 type:complete len:329 (-) Transcript_4762:3752-4738(-)
MPRALSPRRSPIPAFTSPVRRLRRRLPPSSFSFDAFHSSITDIRRAPPPALGGDLARLARTSAVASARPGVARGFDFAAPALGLDARALRLATSPAACFAAASLAARCIKPRMREAADSARFGGRFLASSFSCHESSAISLSARATGPGDPGSAFDSPPADTPARCNASRSGRLCSGLALPDSVTRRAAAFLGPESSVSASRMAKMLSAPNAATTSSSVRLASRLQHCIFWCAGSRTCSSSASVTRAQQARTGAQNRSVRRLHLRRLDALQSAAPWRDAATSASLRSRPAVLQTETTRSVSRTHVFSFAQRQLARAMRTPLSTRGSIA